VRQKSQVHAQLVDHQQGRDVADAALDRRQSDQIALEIVDDRPARLLARTSATVRSPVPSAAGRVGFRRSAGRGRLLTWDLIERCRHGCLDAGK